MNILFFVDSLGAGGIQTLLYNIASRLMLRPDIHIDFLVYEEHGVQDMEKALSELGCCVYRVPSPHEVGLFAAVRAMNDFFMSHHGYDIFHAHCSSKGVIPVYYAGKHGIKVRIVHSHNTKFQTRNPLLICLGNVMKLPICWLSTHYCACSNKAADWMFKSVLTPRRPVKIVNNGILLDKYCFSQSTRDEVRSMLGVSDDTVLIGHVGRFAPQKNHKFLIRLFATYHSYNADSKLVLIGDGELMAECQTLVSERGLENDVIFVGYVFESSPYYHAFDLFLMPSLYEGLPFVGIEAQAAGLPCLFSDTVTPEVKILDTTRFCSLSASDQVWVSLIDEMVKDKVRKDVRTELTESGYNFDVEVEKLYEYYSDIVKCC